MPDRPLTDRIGRPVGRPGTPHPWGAPPRREPRPVGLAIGVAVLVALLLVGAGVVTLQRLSGSKDETIDKVATRQCWDGARVRVDLPCAAITGEQALRWVFTPDQPFTSCRPYTGAGVGQGELESFDCSWEGVNADIFLSRWTTTGDAAGFYTYYFGQPQPYPATGPPIGRLWSSDSPTGGGDPGRAVLYDGHPFSVLVLGPDADLAIDRITPRPVQDLVRQG